MSGPNDNDEQNGERWRVPSEIREIAGVALWKSTGDGIYMNEEAKYVVDKTGWNEGPWTSEPDKVNWTTKAGLPGMIVRNSLGNLCGYAAVTKDHPWFERGYSHGDYPESPEGLIRVHGGLTYSEKCAGNICHVPALGIRTPVEHICVPGPKTAAEGAAVAFGFVGMGREIQLREEEKEIVHMQCEMARQWSGDDPGECPFCGDPWEIVRPGKSQATCDCQEEDPTDE